MPSSPTRGHRRRRSSRSRSRSRPRRGSATGTSRRPPPPTQGSVKSGAAADKPYALGDQPAFDRYDRGVEDRFSKELTSGNGPLGWPYSTGQVGAYDIVVLGTFHIMGVNFAKFEASRDTGAAAFFVQAIVDDLLCEVGAGVRREDVMIRITPGTIDNILLHYASPDTPAEHATEDDVALAMQADAGSKHAPTLVNALWRMKVEYCIRTQDPTRQTQVAMALFHALSEAAPSPHMAQETARVYRKLLDPEHSTSVSIYFARATAKEATAPGIAGERIGLDGAVLSAPPAHQPQPLLPPPQRALAAAAVPGSGGYARAPAHAAVQALSPHAQYPVAAAAAGGGGLRPGSYIPPLPPASQTLDTALGAGRTGTPTGGGVWSGAGAYGSPTPHRGFAGRTSPPPPPPSAGTPGGGGGGGPMDLYLSTLERDLQLGRLEAEVRRERNRLAMTLQKRHPSSHPAASPQHPTSYAV